MKKVILSLLSGLLLASAIQAGDITGKVRLTGKPPPERPIDLNVDPALKAKHPDGLTTRHYEVGVDNALRNVLVYIRGDMEGKTFDPPDAPAVLDHVGGLFRPYVMGIQVGQPLQMRCTDKTICAFHASPLQNRAFSLMPFEGTSTWTFAKPEAPIRFKCDLHPWNVAYVGVFSHPYFAITDKDGAFAIPSVPPGRYTLEIYHPNSGKSAKEVVVSDDRTLADFTVTAK